MQVARISVLLAFLALTACAASSASKKQSEEYVEIPNPGYTMTPNAPETIWVPRSYVESGPPRGSELVKKGYEAAKQGVQGEPAQPQTPQLQVSVPTAGVVKNRVVVVDQNQQLLASQFRASYGRSAVLPSGEAKEKAVGENRGATAKNMANDAKANAVAIISAPGGVEPGKTIVADIYDGFGGGLVKSVDVPLPSFTANDKKATGAAISTAAAALAEKVREVTAVMPWFGRIAAIDGDRVYISVGRESGINIGQKLILYRGGKAVEGLGFAPGPKIGVLEIAGFVGPDGSYGAIKGGGQAYLTDIVGVP